MRGLGTSEPQDRLLTSDELAGRLGCSRDTVYELVRQGLPHLRLGHGRRAEYRFSKEEAAEWLKTCREANSARIMEHSRPTERLFERRRYVGV